ncbi:hypothetical protein SAMN02910353_02931 [Ruminococcus sp. YRD2003]|uniref:hypothetical protein n=1 Tax=Ruminococcus sp. YRD2003 TaxID=1452313 RepID=UPI0008C7B780|nr:hypothetical protein SAMN02910353_02931 [Ruminococcus flavefaciens]
MEVVDKSSKGRIEVWLTNEEQAQYDRSELTRLLLSKVKNGKKCRVVFFMSGNEELKPNIERLLLANLKSC